MALHQGMPPDPSMTLSARSITEDRPVVFERLAVTDRPAAAEASLLNIFNMGRGYTREVHTQALQIAVPVRGVHFVSDGRRDTLVDFNHLTVIHPGVGTRDRHPDFGDVSCLLLTPDPALLDELWRPRARQEARRRVGGLVNSGISAGQFYGAMSIAARAEGGLAASAAFVEELTIALVRAAANDPGPAVKTHGKGPRRLVDRVKDLLAASDENLSLQEIAAAVDASPTYLTDLFRRTEGMPLYRYQMRLRLGRALALLREADDITGLALDLGFSSHSHFSSAFRSVFRTSPSRFRAEARSQA